MYDDNKVIVYKRSELKEGFDRVSANFTFKEWMCKCGKCEKQLLHHLIMDRLEALREALGGKPIRITSGYRCSKHNAAVGGSLRSRHTCGDAADIVVSGVTVRDTGLAAQRLGFSGIKLYRAWTHVDLRPGPKWIVGLD